MMKIFGSIKGLTLPEMMIAGTISLLVGAAAMSVYSSGYSSWVDSREIIDLQREAGIAVERMVRGVQGPSESSKNGLREANAVTIPSTDTVLFTSGIDSVERSFYLSSGELIYDPDTSSGGDEFAIAADVDELAFSLSSNRVTIGLTLAKTSQGRQLEADVTTDVTIRN